MFYAPWSAESQHARTELEKAAQHMQKYVTFAAVNCWQPNGECKLQYNKVNLFNLTKIAQSISIVFIGLQFYYNNIST